MPRKETVLQIFVASPEDVAEERAALEELVREFNRTWGRSLGVRLDLALWETDAMPGFGLDPQDVVNRTLPGEYDIFIGIMWARVGTATPRAGSGTIEEFERAYARFKANPDSVQILFYFKDEPVAPSKLEPSQLAEVNRFKESLGPLGGLYWMFSTTADFQSFVRVHLSRVVQRWTGEAVATEPIGQDLLTDQSVDVPAAGDNDEGFIDLVESANEAFTKVSQVVERMTSAMSELGDSVRTRALDLDAARERAAHPDLKAVKRIIGGAAEDLDQFVARTGLETPVFAELLKRGVTAYGKAAIIAKEFGEEGTKQLSDALDALRSFHAKLSEAKGHLARFRDSVAGTPRMTTAYNHAKRRALDTVDSLLKEYEVAEQLVREVEKSLEALLS